MSVRVLQAVAGADYGGAEAFFVRLAIALEKAGLEQRAAIRENPARARLLRAGGVETVELPFGGRFDFATRRGLRREIATFQPEVVLTWMNRATRLCPAGDFVHIARLGGYYDLKYYRHCDHLVGNTRDICDYLVREGWPEERTHYLPNFVYAEEAEPALREEHYTPAAAPLVFAMGRLHENKAFDVLLEAVRRVPDVYLWLAGDGPLKEELLRQAENLGIKPRVRFLGWRDDTAALLRAADIFVCPSRHEPLGNVVIEAWAQGRPVVAADSFGPGTLIENRETGVLVPIDDPRAMAEAIKGLIRDEDLRARIARGGHEAYLANYTEQAVVAQYLEFFEKVKG